MEQYEITNVLKGYSERMRRLALFEPLDELDRKRVTDGAGNQIDMKGLGLMALLYFFEQKMMRAGKTGVRDLGDFLHKACAASYEFREEQAESLARDIIHTFRPQTGLKRSTAFHNWETGKREIINYSYIINQSFDIETNTQYYTLDDDGLELIFATKEFYSEFQLSINQLILRKQLEKGQFDGALRQIREMAVEVDAIQRRMTRVEHELKRNIISEETFRRYEELLEDTHIRLKIENEEFDELAQFVKETMDRLYYKDIETKEKDTYKKVLNIEKELGTVHADHTGLLKDSFQLKHTALKSAQESLYSMGLELFNFEQEIVSRVVSSPLPPETMKAFTAPFLRGGAVKQWSLLTITESQSFTEERDEQNRGTYPHLDDDGMDEHERQLVRDKFSAYFSALIRFLKEEPVTTLGDVLERVRKTEPQFLEEKLYYNFWIILHQLTPLKAGASAEEEKGLVYELQAMLPEGELSVEEIKGDVLNPVGRFSIQNMTVTWRNG